MTVAAQIDGHAVDRSGEVGPVIQIEAAQEHLVRFTRAAVLRHDQAGHGFQHVTGSQQRPDSKVHLPDDAFRCTACLPREVFSSAGDHELFKCLFSGVRADISGQAQQTQYGSENEAH